MHDAIYVPPNPTAVVDTRLVCMIPQQFLFKLALVYAKLVLCMMPEQFLFLLVEHGHF